MMQPNPNNDTFDETLLTAYLDNELNDTERALVDEELRRSESTRQLLADLKSIRELVQQVHYPELKASFANAPWHKSIATAATPIDPHQHAETVWIQPSVSESVWWIRHRTLLSMAASVAILLSAVTWTWRMRIVQPLTHGSAERFAFEDRSAALDHKPSRQIDLPQPVLDAEPQAGRRRNAGQPRASVGIDSQEREVIDSKSKLGLVREPVNRLEQQMQFNFAEADMLNADTKQNRSERNDTETALGQRGADSRATESMFALDIGIRNDDFFSRADVEQRGLHTSPVPLFALWTSVANEEIEIDGEVRGRVVFPEESSSVAPLVCDSIIRKEEDKTVLELQIPKVDWERLSVHLKRSGLTVSSSLPELETLDRIVANKNEETIPQGLDKADSANPIAENRTLSRSTPAENRPEWIWLENSNAIRVKELSANSSSTDSPANVRKKPTLQLRIRLKNDSELIKK